MAICPKDHQPCVDDLCYGSGCMRMGGYEMLQRCRVCNGLIDNEEPDYSTCTCGDEFPWEDDE